MSTNMMSLLDLISQNQPHLQTHQALLVIGLQNDFIRPDGRLPVDSRGGFVDRIHTVVPKLRQLSANIIWVQTLYEADRMANDPTTGEGDAVVVGGLVDGVESSTDEDEDLPKDLLPPTQSRSSRHKQRALDLLKKVSARRRTAPREVSQSTAEEDEELFLLRSPKRAPACMPNTAGAEFIDAVKPSISTSDSILQTTNYSAFLGTKLLMILRARLVTELYICGCLTNISILATVIDAARHGFRINLVVDCLGFRKQNRHDEALKRMEEFFDANIITSREVLSREPLEETEQPRREDGPKDSDNNLEDLIGKLQLNERGPMRKRDSNNSGDQSPSSALDGRRRTLSDASVAESRTTTDTKLSDDQFAEALVKGAKVPNENRAPPATKPNLVKSKIRMRSRTNKSKREGDQKPKPDSTKKGESSSHKPAQGDDAEPSRPQTAKPVKSPKEAEPSASKTPRPPAITKAESSDKLRRESPAKHEQPLKSSVSHPTLSSSNSDAKESKLSPSRMRQALSRSSKSDLRKVLPTKSEQSPTKPAVETPPRSPAKPTSEPLESPSKPSSKSPITPSKPSSKSPITPSKPSNPPKNATMGKKLQSLATLPVLRPGDRIAEGDSRIIYDFFSSDFRHPTDPSKPFKDLVFQQLFTEVRWQKMLHQQGEVPRLVCCQGEIGADGSMPVYRHPTDQVLPLLHFSPKVQVVRKQAEKLVGHPLNHVLIQLYRSGNDYISEHSDKTLDIVLGSSIANVSFGAQRTMRLRTKKSAKVECSEEAAARHTQRVAMPHNSMFVLGLESNMKWLHGINPDKRLEAERSEDERAFSGIRISLTFRHIGTFLDAENSAIWGQGATSKKERDAQDVINDDEDENEKIVRAFSRENHSSDFDWDECYGAGFDVLHFRNAPEDVPILFGSTNAIKNKMIQVLLWENKINHILLEAPPTPSEFDHDRQLCFRDNDVNHTEVSAAVPIMFYLDKYHPLDRDDRGRATAAHSFDILATLCSVMKYWSNRHLPIYLKDLIHTLECLEERLAMGPGPFIAGRRFSVGDCATWPLLDELVAEWEGWSEERFPLLTEYYRMLWKKKKSVAKLRPSLPDVRKAAGGGDEEEEGGE